MRLASACAGFSSMLYVSGAMADGTRSRAVLLEASHSSPMVRHVGHDYPGTKGWQKARTATKVIHLLEFYRSAVVPNPVRKKQRGTQPWDSARRRSSSTVMAFSNACAGIETT